MHIDFGVDRYRVADGGIVEDDVIAISIQNTVKYELLDAEFLITWLIVQSE